MTTVDSLYLALIAVLLLIDRFVLWPSFLRRSPAAPGRARVWLWSSAIILLWTMAGAGVALWFTEGRSWAVLGFVAPHGWRLWVTIGLVLALVVSNARPIVRLARSKRPRRIQMADPSVERRAPHTGTELAWWIALSLTAGFCEELVFRGYLIWAFRAWLGLWGAAAVSLVIFALAHAYQGAKGVLAVGVVGAFFTLVVLLLGSLVAAMVLHALVDIGQGVIAWLALRGMPGGQVDRVGGSGDPIAGPSA